jgi:hypothetical protein
MTIEAYLSGDKKLLFVYIGGGAGPEGYSVKFIFSNSGYITRLIATDDRVASFDLLDATSTD